ncbi:ATP-binding protein [Klebsiella variicola]|uniref:ATP-binding protein n=1 Tax=Klebsiella variicola TaxID=244366 RepID=UPI00236BF736|nr:ATP-binding protein [Klebsiella variicola]HCB0988420.1 ATP-binding protein [Klebsiella variicola subsp. variicola]HDK6382314.1 ATP-binding protein [Klebsiella pneumoniae]HDS5939906.1 ATP-binding protein [Klebsiella variicola]HDS5950337.1 ATP-binding protein [Klebsiella variicola]
MAEKSFNVEVQIDYLDKVSKSSALQAVAELVWNALDADADNVYVDLVVAELGLSQILIRDDGKGIPYESAEKLFSSLGGSWKKDKIFSERSRFLHGKEGQGRFKAFSIGRFVEWNTTYFLGDILYEYKIKGTADNKKTISVSERIKSDGVNSGTTVSIFEILKSFTSLTPDKLSEFLSATLALYLNKYKAVKVFVNNEQIDPVSQISFDTTYKLDDAFYSNESHPYELQIIEWKSVKDNEIFLCDKEGFPLISHEKKVRGTSAYSYSVYLKSSHLTELSHAGVISLMELEPSLKPVLHQAECLIKEHFNKREHEKSRELLDKWKSEGVYPYNGKAVNIVEEAERKVFDIMALNVIQYIPQFDNGDLKLKKFQFKLLKQIVGSCPDDLRTILEEVLSLTSEKQNELAEILKDASLSAVIGVSKIISDRLKFISGLENVLFNKNTRKIFKERSQLHKIMADNTWFFGESFTLSVSDKSLTEVLRSHLRTIGIHTPVDEKVTRIDGRVGIVDLMLTKSIGKNYPDEREHIVIELKAPSVNIGQTEIEQVKSYAYAVAEDERFNGLKTKWNFWVISNDLTTYARRELKQTNLPDGAIYQAEEMTIWIKTWSQLIQENKHRLGFLRDQLNLSYDREDGLQFLKKKYAEYTEGVVFDNEPQDIGIEQ